MISQQKTEAVTAISQSETFIGQKHAQEMIAAWQSQEPDGIFSILYGRHVFDSLLAAPGSEAVRVFNAINEKGKQAFVFTPTDVNGSAICSNPLQTLERMMDLGDLIFDLGYPCPPRCPGGDPDISKGYIWQQAVQHTWDLTVIGEQIGREKAQEMIMEWRREETEGVSSFLFERVLFETILAIPGCAGIRFFNALDESKEQVLMLVPVDKTGSNILQYHSVNAEGTHLRESLIGCGGVRFYPKPVTEI